MNSASSLHSHKSCVSVIIPAYNAEEWLAEALESVVAQGSVIKECIVVNDGSTDDTAEIVAEYAASNSLFKLETINNSGVSAARNKGIEMATGEWLVFLDSDDILLPGCVEFLLQCALENGCEIAEGRVFPFQSDPGTADTEKLIKKLSKTYCRKEGKYRIITGWKAAEFSLYQTAVNSSLYAKVYHRSLWSGIMLPVGEIYEDLSVFYKVAMRSNRYFITEEPVYCYRERPESQIHSFAKGRLVVLDVTERICKDFEQRLINPENNEEEMFTFKKMLCAAKDRRLAACFNMTGMLMNNYFEGSEKIVEECVDYVKKNSAASAFNPKVRLKNRLGAVLGCIMPRRMLKNLLKRFYS